MNRNFFITIHLVLSAFLAPFILLASISGGLYLIGIKGSVEQNPVFSTEDIHIDTASNQLKADIDALLRTAGVNDYDFEYVKVKGDTLYTRPTSTDHYIIQLGDTVEVIAANPDLQSAMIELHKGHGPTAFKTFQKLAAVGLALIVASGLWLGLSAARLRARTLLITLGGTLVLFSLVLF